MVVERVKLKKEIYWTPKLIKELRGKRTQLEFGALIGAPKNTVWRWEAGQSRPDANYSRQLSDLAEKEHFLQGWQLVGSITIVGDLETAKDEIAKLFKKSLKRSAEQA